MMPQKRQSIHKNKKSDEEPSDKEDLRKCDTCKKTFLVYEDENQSPVHLKEEDVKAWLELKKKTGIYPDLTELLVFQCPDCKPESTQDTNQEPISFTTRASLNSQPTTQLASLNAGDSANQRSLLPCFLLIAISMLMCLGAMLAMNNPIENVKNFVEDHIMSSERSFEVNMHKLTHAEELLHEELDSLEIEYRNQEEKVWYTLAAGVKKVMRSHPNQPSVFLMLYDSKSAGNTAECLAKAVSKPVTKFLMKSPRNPVIVSGEELKQKILLDDPGQLLVQFNNTVRERGAMIVINLQDVPSKVATSFHFFCDSYSPLIDRAVYFFTLQVDKLTRYLQKTAEDRLTDLWSEEMEGNVLRPLITRLTPNVIRILNDSPTC